jgi:hypothetical protein
VSGRVGWLAGATALAAMAGVAIGATVVGDDGGTATSRAAAAPSPTPAPPRVGLQHGPARIALPSGWRPLGRHASLPGLEAATEVQAPHSTVALDLRRPETPSLLPAKVAAAFGERVPAPTTVRPAGRAAWRYELPQPAPGERVAALVLPTTKGVITIACVTGADAFADARRECGEAMTALGLEGAAALPPTPHAAARIALPSVMARLNADRRAGRKALARTRSPTRRQRSAIGIARAYRRAATTLRPLAAGRAVPLVGSLRALDGAYLALARASLRRNAPAARRAGARIRANERLLARRLRVM